MIREYDRSLLNNTKKKLYLKYLNIDDFEFLQEKIIQHNRNNKRVLILKNTIKPFEVRSLTKPEVIEFWRLLTFRKYCYLDFKKFKKWVNRDVFHNCQFKEIYYFLNKYYWTDISFRDVKKCIFNGVLKKNDYVRIKKYLRIKDLTVFQFSKLRELILKPLLTKTQREQLKEERKARRKYMRQLYPNLMEEKRVSKKLGFILFYLFFDRYEYKDTRLKILIVRYHQWINNYFRIYSYKLWLSNLLDSIVSKNNFAYKHFNSDVLLRKQKINNFFFKVNLYNGFFFKNKKYDKIFFIDYLTYKLNYFFYIKRYFFNIDISELTCFSSVSNYIYIRDNSLENSNKLLFNAGNVKDDLINLLRREFKYYFGSLKMFLHLKNYLMNLKTVNSYFIANTFSWISTWSTIVPFFDDTNECYIDLENKFEKFKYNIYNLNYFYKVITFKKYFYSNAYISDFFFKVKKLKSKFKLNRLLNFYFNLLLNFYLKNYYYLLNHLKYFFLKNFKIILKNIYFILKLKKVFFIFYFLNRRMLLWKKYDKEDLYFL